MVKPVARPGAPLDCAPMPVPNAFRRALLAAPLGWSAAAAVAQPRGAEAPASAAAATCSHCKDRLQTVDALRRALPSAWNLQLEDEPVMGGRMLVLRAGPKSAPPLLLVHGLGQNGFTDWLPVLPALARRWRVLAVDLPGFGYSSAPLGKYSPTNYARVLNALLAREDTGPVVAVGHSLGGAVALRLAGEFPQRVNKLVVADCAGILQRTAFTKHGASLPLAVENMPEALKEPVARLRDLGNLLVERVFGLPGDPTGVLRANEPLWALALRDRGNVNAALALVDENFSELVWRLPQPVQLIWGEADAVAPLRTGQLLARRLPRAALATLPGVGHTPMDAAPDDFQRLLLKALQEDPPPRAAPEPPGAALQDLELRNVVDRRYSGRYGELRIEGSSAVRLHDLVADRIVVRDSIVQMTGVQVNAADVAVEVVNSELVATACDFGGRVAIRADLSRLDLAGVKLAAQAFGVQALGRSRLVASVCELQDAMYRGWWHEDRELEAELLDPRAAPRPPAPASRQP